METIGLIAAMPQESKALLRIIKEWKRAALGTFRGARFRLLDRDCLMVTTGMGLERAIKGARALVAETGPDLLVSFGIAGAVRDDLRIGDVVVAGNTCVLDMGRPGPFRPLACLSKEAWEAAAQALQSGGARLVAGTAITTRGSQVVPEPVEEMAHPVLEMETAGIAQVAAEVGIPLVSIRAISDGPQAPIPFDLEAILNEEYNLRIGKLLLTVLHRPQIVFQSRRMMRNSRKAADHAAKALVAALSQPSPIIDTADQHLPYNGGFGPKSLVNVDFTSVQDSVEFRISFTKCDSKPQTNTFADIRHETWTGCASTISVELYPIIGGGHAWPGGQGGWAGF